MVFNDLINKSENEVWEIINKFSDLKVKEYKQIFDDLIGIQESESEYKTGKTEGGKKVETFNKYERKPSVRKEAIEFTDWNARFGDLILKKFMGVGEKVLLKYITYSHYQKKKGEETETNPETDLAVLCANCHRMVHRKKDVTLAIQELKEKMNKGIL